tara:strand:+ start:595 stop:807 length:213 start_codon:yes stop_codon:yes gene_type:complete
MIKIIPKNLMIDFLSLNFTKNIIDKGISNNNPSYLTNVAQAMHPKLKNNEMFVFFKKSAIAKTNMKMNSE